MTLDDQTRIELIQLVKTAVSEAVEQHPLSPEEVHWVRMAIKAEAERASLRKAIIEKSLAGLAWMALAGIGTWAVSFVADHWK
jgi:hypothetical protein